MGRTGEREVVMRTDGPRLRDITAPPNVISILRLALVPVALWFLWSGERAIAVAVLLVMIASDSLDGYVARRTGRITELGKILDPLADKVAVDSVLAFLVVRGEFPLWALVFLVLRDLAIATTALSLARRLGSVPPSNAVGKATIVALAGLTIAYVADLKVLEGPFLIVAVGLAAVSLVSYGRVAAAARGSASGAPASGSDAAPASGSEASRTGER